MSLSCLVQPGTGDHLAHHIFNSCLWQNASRHSSLKKEKSLVRLLQRAQAVLIEEMCLQKPRLKCVHAAHMWRVFRGCIRSPVMYRLRLDHQSKAVIQGLSCALNLITLEISGTGARGFQWDYGTEWRGWCRLVTQRSKLCIQNANFVLTWFNSTNDDWLNCCMRINCGLKSGKKFYYTKEWWPVSLFSNNFKWYKINRVNFMQENIFETKK